MRSEELEAAVRRVEGIEVVVRSARNAELGDFGKKKAADKKRRPTEWLEHRICPPTGDHGVDAIDGSGNDPNRNTRLETVRES